MGSALRSERISVVVLSRLVMADGSSSWWPSPARETVQVADTVALWVGTLQVATHGPVSLFTNALRKLAPSGQTVLTPSVAGLTVAGPLAGGEPGRYCWSLR